MDNFNQTTYSTPDRGLLEILSKWSGFVGIMTIITGALTCLGAIGTLGISLIPGIIQIILGVKLRNAKTSIDRYLAGDAGEINGIFPKFRLIYEATRYLNNHRSGYSGYRYINCYNKWNCSFQSI